MTRLGTRWALVAASLVGAAAPAVRGGAPGDGCATGALPGMLVTSLGCGLRLPALAVAAVTGTTGEDAGIGSAVFTRPSSGSAAR
ncbi:hypothetical protein [Actinomadura spongiicola]|uniref:hypothetical protein n=1 Tax=Actinomadura spongiicola TaxID=2303421 RepID=UPI0011C17425|nr:hypothetical protein [Actinomadura spongiicola]